LPPRPDNHGGTATRIVEILTSAFDIRHFSTLSYSFLSTINGSTLVARRRSSSTMHLAAGLLALPLETHP
jgi:hypothetical protein